MWHDACRSEPDYGHVGSTLGDMDASRARRHTAQLGHGERDLRRAASGLRDWVCQRGLGARVHPPDASTQVGSTVLVVLGFGPCTVIVPNRVVAVVEEPNRRGFAYGTLPGHQERGEESFVAELLEDGRVMGSITVDAVPQTAAARAMSPAVGWLQRRAIRRYLEAWSSFVRSGEDDPPARC
jgi:uncharacterized protein (UPF0548 family)